MPRTKYSSTCGALWLLLGLDVACISQSPRKMTIALRLMFTARGFLELHRSISVHNHERSLRGADFFSVPKHHFREQCLCREFLLHCHLID